MRLAFAKSSTRGARGLVAALVLLGFACGDDNSPTDDPNVSRDSTARSAPSSEDAGDAAPVAQRLGASPTVADLVDALGSSHAELRTVVGPHRIEQRSKFSLRPAKPLGRPPRPGEPIETEIEVVDELDLVWSEPSDDGPQFSLRQRNDHDERRELVVLGERAFTRLREDPWYVRELDGELHELWLDDAIRGVHDLVEFVAPQLAVSAPEATKVEGRSAFAFSLSLAPQKDLSLVRAAPTSEWRAAAKLETIEGRIVVDAQSGAALEAQLTADFSMRDGAGRPMRGHAELTRSLQIGPQPVPSAPAATPLPERHRYEVERKKLLDGLAAL